MEDFFLKTIDKLDEELAHKLIGKHINFTYHNKEDNTCETMPGKVLDYKDNKITIDTCDIIFENQIKIVENNEFIEEYSLNDITDIYVFEEYNDEFYSLLDNVEDEDLDNKIFTITNIYGNTIKSRVIDYDIFTITLKYNDKYYDYPLYFISEIR